MLEIAEADWPVILSVDSVREVSTCVILAGPYCLAVCDPSLANRISCTPARMLFLYQ